MTIEITNSDFSYGRITEYDIHFAFKLWPILIELARNQQVISYQELVSLAKLNYPDDVVVSRLIPVTTGRRLELPGLYCKKKGLPNITSLIINQHTGDCGQGLKNEIDTGRERGLIFQHDWKNEDVDFQAVIKLAEEAVIRDRQKKKKRSRDESKKLMADFYKLKSALYPEIKNDMAVIRERIIGRLVMGDEIEDAFEEAVRG